MRYDETPTFTFHIDVLRGERAELERKIDAMAQLKRGIPGAANKRAKLRARLKTVNRCLENAIDLSDFTWPDLFRMWSEACGWKWTDEELVLFDQEIETYEGRGERPLRHRLGLRLNATLDSCDLPTGEVKYIGPNMEPIRVGKVGKRLFVRVLRDLPDELLTDEMLDGEVSAGKLYHKLPEQVRQTLVSSLSTTNVLAQYPALYLTTPEGYCFIPREHYDKALNLACITQMSPKYRLKREYVEEQVKRTLTVNPSAATVRAFEALLLS